MSTSPVTATNGNVLGTGDDELMHVSHLSLLDFRSFGQVDVEFTPGVNTLVGQNGQGKTNLVEALGYVSTLGSHRVSNDNALIRSGAARAVVRTRIVRGDRASVIEIEIAQGRANRAQLNRAPVQRPRDILGITRTVLFAPEDLVLVKGEPDARRRFLDDLAILLLPRMAGVFADYARVLRQRSALLKSAGAARRSAVAPDLRTLDIWDAKLAQIGAQIVRARLQLVAALGPYIAVAYEQLSSGKGDAKISYRSSLSEAFDDAEDIWWAGDKEPAIQFAELAEAELERHLLEALGRLRAKELDRGVCLVGPHRDDLTLTLGGLPAKGYASHGESWSFALALRLASYRLLTEGPNIEQTDTSFWFADLGPDTEPILILDDVFAELDTTRRTKLADHIVGAGQVLITAAVAEDIPDQLVGARLQVMGGTVTRG